MTTKLRSWLPSNYNPLLAVSTLKDVKQNVSARIYRKVEFLKKVSTLVHRKREAATMTTKNTFTHTCASIHANYNPLCFINRVSPKYHYQIRFLVQTYGLKQAALIIKS
ncbi:hypothetical protein HMI55_005640 [Coelomomyces lativittatus]|nr:hypothetical protein HMI55_005640 [Coelomomyces lativittatus]